MTKVALAKKLGVSRSSLYYESKKRASDEELKQKIIAVMEEHPAYGHRRVAISLTRNKKPIIRVMNKFGLKPKIRRGWKPAKPEDLNRPETRVENVLKILCPIRANIVWAGDFTYIWFIDRFWYVATVIDIYTREIVGWHIANHHTTALIMEAFSDAARRTKTSPRYFHSDQGSEYVSGGYESLLAQHGTVASHSRKSSPWQNGFQESFYSQFKLELGSPNRFNHIGELIEAIHRQIAYYNNRRIHSALKMSPFIFRQKQVLKYAAVAASESQYLLIQR
ncbi:MAG: IS3 family transposase [Candidatus Staskawiczbacteria bacterium]|nr:IS3 family transposase [Candidatus Staskawiczbacteria bacterium]